MLSSFRLGYRSCGTVVPDLARHGSQSGHEHLNDQVRRDAKGRDGDDDLGGQAGDCTGVGAHVGQADGPVCEADAQRQGDQKQVPPGMGIDGVQEGAPREREGCG